MRIQRTVFTTNYQYSESATAKSGILGHYYWLLGIGLALGGAITFQGIHPHNAIFVLAGLVLGIVGALMLHHFFSAAINCIGYADTKKSEALPPMMLPDVLRILGAANKRRKEYAFKSAACFALIALLGVASAVLDYTAIPAVRNTHELTPEEIQAAQYVYIDDLRILGQYASAGYSSNVLDYKYYYLAEFTAKDHQPCLMSVELKTDNQGVQKLGGHIIHDIKNPGNELPNEVISGYFSLSPLSSASWYRSKYNDAAAAMSPSSFVLSTDSRFVCESSFEWSFFLKYSGLRFIAIAVWGALALILWSKSKQTIE